MGKAIQKFTSDFQDMYVVKNTTIDLFSNNLTVIDLDILNQQFENISKQLKDLSTLSRNATVELLTEQMQVAEILQNKVDYVSDIANLFLYLNSFYDMNNLVDLKDYRIRECNGDSGILYNNLQDALTLKCVATNYKPLLEVSTNNNKELVAYNTNRSVHSGLLLSSPILDTLGIKTVTLYRSDDTFVVFNIQTIVNNNYFIQHELLESSRIVIETSSPIQLKDLSLELVNFKYAQEGFHNLDSFEYLSSDFFNLIYNCVVPAKTFANLDITVRGLDINKNVISSLNLTFPLSQAISCKRLDNIDWEVVEKVEGVYINNILNKEKTFLSKDNLQSLSNKNEVYVLFKSKTKGVNTSFKPLSNQAIKIINKNIKYLEISPILEMFTFNQNVTPSLSILSGATKNE